MKKILITIMSVAAMLLAGSCQKPSGSTQTTTLKIEFSDIATQTLTVSVTFEGDEPALVRMIPATRLDEVMQSVKDIKDEAAAKAYLTKNGLATVLPYKAVTKDLTPDTEYVVGAVAFNDNMDPIAVAMETFRTQVFGSTTVGDASGAGSVTSNELE